ncbi:unnamed protein product [Umbelopsis ramanniana]
MKLEHIAQYNNSCLSGFFISLLNSLRIILDFEFIGQVIMFSDLECDYINPIDLCNKLNQFVLPEMGAQAFLFAMFLINGSWLAALLNLPLVVFNVQKVTNNRHMYDATEIFRTLSIHKKECFFKLAFYLLCFFFYLYRMIVALIADS